jgi:hypothetical protein
MFRVAIRHVDYLSDSFEHIYPGLDNAIFLGEPVRCLVASKVSSDERIAAKGWVKSFGLERREFLKSNGAPEWLIEASTSVDGILKAFDLVQAPGCFCPYDDDYKSKHFILDNHVECWLISVTRLQARVQRS